MKLFYNPPSPYARKVVVVIHEKNLKDRVELCALDPWKDPPELLGKNPIGKVPALLMDDGAVLTESTTISQHLDRFETGPRLSDRGNVDPADIDLMSRGALAQGVIDAAFAAVIERRRPAQYQWSDWPVRQRRAIERTLPSFKARSGRFDLGDITLACALGYLDFRLPEIPWRNVNPHLAGWFDEISQRPSMRATKP